MCCMHCCVQIICMQIYMPFDRIHAFVYVVCVGGGGRGRIAKHMLDISMLKKPRLQYGEVTPQYRPCCFSQLLVAPPSSFYSPVLARIPPSAVGSSPLKDPSREWLLRGLPCIHCAERKLRSESTSIIRPNQVSAIVHATHFSRTSCLV